MFQYFVGWPLADLCWQATWGALFLYVMLRARPRIDGLTEIAGMIEIERSSACSRR